MKKLICGAMVLALVVPAMAVPPNLFISLGIRETGSTAAIGDNGGSSGGIEWVDLDNQQLVLDGTWQTFSFDLANLPLTPFAGGTANGILDGSAGTIEHIRIKSGGNTNIIRLWIDDVADTIDPVGPPPPVTTTFGTFEGFALDSEVMFQEPEFSGSTAGFVAPVPLTYSRTVFDQAFSGSASQKVEWRFENGNLTNWVRLTTFGTGGLLQPNPTIRFDQSSVVSFKMLGIPEPGTLSLLGLSAVVALRRRR